MSNNADEYNSHSAKTYQFDEQLYETQPFSQDRNFYSDVPKATFRSGSCEKLGSSYPLTPNLPVRQKQRKIKKEHYTISKKRWNRLVNEVDTLSYGLSKIVNLLNHDIDSDIEVSDSEVEEEGELYDERRTPTTPTLFSKFNLVDIGESSDEDIE